MGNVVVVIDTSGSMYSKLGNIKTFMESFLEFMILMGHKIALVSFSNDVHIESYYTTNLAQLMTQVNGLSASGCTALFDAILVGLVFENPRADFLVVFSDGHDNCSDSGEENWQTKADELGISVIPYPLDGFEDSKLVPYAGAYTKRLVTVPEAAKKWLDIAGRVKAVKIVKKPEDFVRLEILKK